MPTVLGLTGCREPYFAFGRDVLIEPGRPVWSVGYEAGFRAVTNDRILRFDEREPSVTDRAGGGRTDDPDSLADRFKALIQQYYAHIERKSYVVPR